MRYGTGFLAFSMFRETMCQTWCLLEVNVFEHTQHQKYYIYTLMKHVVMKFNQGMHLAKHTIRKEGYLESGVKHLCFTPEVLDRLSIYPDHGSPLSIILNDLHNHLISLFTVHPDTNTSKNIRVQIWLEHTIHN